jgi:hypothetical protein
MNKDFFLKEIMNDTLFKYTGNRILEPFLIFDTKGKGITPDARANGNYFADHTNEYFFVQKLFGAGKYLYYTWSYKKSGKAIYDISSKTSYSVSNTALLTDDITGGVKFEPQYCNDGVFYSWIEALALKKYVASEAFEKAVVIDPAKKAALKKLVDSLSDFDNPVLIAVKVK